MKRITLPTLLVLLLAATCAHAMASAPPGVGSAAPWGTVRIPELTLRGRIEGENIVFDMTFVADVERAGTALPIVVGDVAILESDLPKGARISRKDGSLLLTFDSRGKQHVAVTFAGRALKDEDWRQSTFDIPRAGIRRLSVVADREDLEVVFPGALRVEREKNAEGLKEVSAFLGAASGFSVRWKPTVRKLTGDLVVSCDVNNIASASVGALRIDTIFTYRVVQGSLRKLQLRIPTDVNVTQVMGEDIQDWNIEETDGRILTVSLSRSKEDVYQLRVGTETILPTFPCNLTLPVVVPEGVMRSSGFLMLGTDSAIKLLVGKALGLTQIDQAAFPQVAMRGEREARGLPSQSKFAYQYANMPYTLALSADDIVPQYSSSDELTLSIQDNDLVFDGSLDLDIRDAPARSVEIATETGWTVANVDGAAVGDYEVKDSGTNRTITVHFREATLGRTIIRVRMEQTLREDAREVRAPGFRVQGASTERGYLVLAAETGLRFQDARPVGLREVQTASVPMRIADAQLAYRFKTAEWALQAGLDRTKPTTHSEVFHLVSIGEGVLYCSGVFTYHIEGAPVRTFKVRIPETFQNIEFSGRDIRGWEHEGDVWTISLQEKVLGDYTLLITYDAPFAYKGEQVLLGGVGTVGTTSETGYLIVASSASLGLSGQHADPTMIQIDRSELPSAYLLLLKDPVLRAFKYTASPHNVTLRIERHESEALLDQVADHAVLQTQISRDGEVVTTAGYLVKNLSRQYFVISLPDGARLWNTRVVGASGVREDVTSMQEGEHTLIPIPRLRNPNMPVRVEVTYAEGRKKPGWAGRTFTFRAPRVENCHSTFAKWDFQGPQRYSLAAVGGNMTPATVGWSRGIARVFVNVVRLYGVALRYLGAWIFFLIVLTAVLCARAYNRGRGRKAVWRSILGVAIVGVVFGFAVVAGGGRLWRFGSAVTNIFGVAMGVAKNVSVSNTVGLAGADLTTKMRLAPFWMGAGGSIGFALVAFVLAVLCGTRARRGSLMGPLAAGLALVGAAEFAFGEIVITGALAMLVVGAAIRMAVRRSYRRGTKKRDELEDVEIPQPPLMPALPVSPGPGSEGHARIGLLAILAGVCVIASALAEGEPAPLRELSVRSVDLTIKAPPMEQDLHRSADVAAVLDFEVDEPGTFSLLGAPAVLTAYELNSRNLALETGPQGYLLNAGRKGTYRISLKYSLPVTERNGLWAMTLQMPANLRNRVTAEIPAKDLDVESPEAVLLKMEEKEDVTEAVVVYGSERNVRVTWRARARKTNLEKVVFFCDVNTLAIFKPGLIDLSSVIRYQIAQGELRATQIAVPDGMSVTAVRADGLSTWRFDPEKRLLELLFEKAVTGIHRVEISAQVGCDGLPYDAVLGALRVQDAARQRGAIALAVPDTVQVDVGKGDGLNPMNIEDFPAQKRAVSSTGVELAVETRRAYRYHRLPASLSVHAEQVLPEVRVKEDGSVSVADERIVLSSHLTVQVAKAGIFSQELRIPRDYDVDSLTGQDISHWDEVETGEAEAAENEKRIVVHFTKKVMGSRVLNLVIARTEKGIEKQIEVPRVRVTGSVKHVGHLAVSGERGVRMTCVDREGVSEVNPRELNINQSGVLAFKLLRPDWSVVLKTEVVDPTIRSEILQRVDLSEGKLLCTAYVRYTIDNAGCKEFRLQAPAPGVTLAVTGRNVSRVYEEDAGKGVWVVELHGKVENDYAMEVRYQVPFDPTTGDVSILPVRALGVDSQKGYLAVMSGGRVQVRPVGERPGLKPEDSRSIPAAFGAGDLAGAIQCYRAVSGDYQLDLSVVRHDAASVLQADVKRVQLTSVVSDSGQTLTQASIDLTVGDLSFLEMTLPGEASTLWSAFVDGKAVAVSRSGNAFRIPLGEPVPGESTSIEMVYATPVSDRLFSSKQRHDAPAFGLPLKEIEWTFYVVPGRRYHGFGGTMELERYRELIQAFDTESYMSYNARQSMSDRDKAKQVLAESEVLARKGMQKRARRALESALNYSQGDEAFHEDARVQYKSLAAQQGVVGLVQRRDEMRFARNLQDEEQIDRLEGFQKGQFTADYVTEVQQSLQAEENASLMDMAGKMLDQQSAAERVMQAIRIAMPTHGRVLTFKRSLQINPDAEMFVTFKVSSGRLTRWLLLVAASAATVVLAALLLRRKTTAES